MNAVLINTSTALNSDSNQSSAKAAPVGSADGSALMTLLTAPLYGIASDATTDSYE
jgi:hypothetical protein